MLVWPETGWYGKNGTQHGSPDDPGQVDIEEVVVPVHTLLGAQGPHLQLLLPGRPDPLHLLVHLGDGDAPAHHRAQPRSQLRVARLTPLVSLEPVDGRWK